MSDTTGRKPSFRLPPGACNTHCHVFGPTARFPYSADRKYTPAEASKESLAAMHARMGISRAVVVHPTAHPLDNAVTLDAIASSNGAYRGVALVDAHVGLPELERLHRGGMRGVRFSFLKKLGGGPPRAVVAQVAERIRDLGWHVLLLIDADALGEFRELLATLPVPFVIDMMGCMRASAGGTEQPAFAELLRILDLENAWIKISGIERTSALGAPYADAYPFASALIDKLPDRAIWGTDWPHPNLEGHALPDDADLVDAIPHYVSDSALQHNLLVANPARLYGF